MCRSRRIEAGSTALCDGTTTAPDALTVAVIALAVLLGWMVGRVGWSMRSNRARYATSCSPEDDAPTPVLGHSERSGLAISCRSFQRVSRNSALSHTPPTNLKLKLDRRGLVVYEQGKVVFRMPAPVRKSSSHARRILILLPCERSVHSGRRLRLMKQPWALRRTIRYLLERVEPAYPEEARQKHIQGPVVLERFGRNRWRGSGTKVVSGEPLLAKAATDAVRQWRFQPHRVQGRPVEFETRITVNFALPSNLLLSAVS